MQARHSLSSPNPSHPSSPLAAAPSPNGSQPQRPRIPLRVLKMPGIPPSSVSSPPASVVTPLVVRPSQRQVKHSESSAPLLSPQASPFAAVPLSAHSSPLISFSNPLPERELEDARCPSNEQHDIIEPSSPSSHASSTSFNDNEHPVAVHELDDLPSEAAKPSNGKQVVNIGEAPHLGDRNQSELIGKKAAQPEASGRDAGLLSPLPRDQEIESHFGERDVPDGYVEEEEEEVESREPYEEEMLKIMASMRGKRRGSVDSHHSNHSSKQSSHSNHSKQSHQSSSSNSSNQSGEAIIEPKDSVHASVVAVEDLQPQPELPMVQEYEVVVEDEDEDETEDHEQHHTLTPEGDDEENQQGEINEDLSLTLEKLRVVDLTWALCKNNLFRFREFLYMYLFAIRPSFRDLDAFPRNAKTGGKDSDSPMPSSIPPSPSAVHSPISPADFSSSVASPDFSSPASSSPASPATVSSPRIQVRQLFSSLSQRARLFSSAVRKSPLLTGRSNTSHQILVSQLEPSSAEEEEIFVVPMLTCILSALEQSNASSGWQLPPGRVKQFFRKQVLCGLRAQDWSDIWEAIVQSVAHVVGPEMWDDSCENCWWSLFSTLAEVCGPVHRFILAQLEHSKRLPHSGTLLRTYYFSVEQKLVVYRMWDSLVIKSVVRAEDRPISRSLLLLRKQLGKKWAPSDSLISTFIGRIHSAMNEVIRTFPAMNVSDCDTSVRHLGDILFEAEILPFHFADFCTALWNTMRDDAGLVHIVPRDLAARSWQRFLNILATHWTLSRTDSGTLNALSGLNAGIRENSISAGAGLMSFGSMRVPNGGNGNGNGIMSLSSAVLAAQKEQKKLVGDSTQVMNNQSSSSISSGSSIGSGAVNYRQRYNNYNYAQQNSFLQVPQFRRRESVSSVASSASSAAVHFEADGKDSDAV